jgi:threonine/homoserine/homoserine lactone efflux protein
VSVDHLLVFAAAYLAIVILPGPAVTALLARVLARGPRGAAGFIVGTAVGAVVWLAVAAAGFAALAAAFAPVLVVIRYAGAAYLLWLAWKLWTSPVRDVEVSESAAGGRNLFLTGLAINIGNPKAAVFFLALLPAVVDLERLTLLAFGELALLVVAIVCAVFGAYTLLAVRARRLIKSAGARRLVNRGSAVAVAGAAAAIAAR